MSRDWRFDLKEIFLLDETGRFVELHPSITAWIDARIESRIRSLEQRVDAIVANPGNGIVEKERV